MRRARCIGSPDPDFRAPRFRSVLLVGAAVTSLLAGATGAAADDFTSDFENSGPYAATVTSNTATINNNAPGVWTGTVETNQGFINNNPDAVWIGNVESNSLNISNNDSAHWTGDIGGNTGNIGNAGGTWTGNVLANSAAVINDNRSDEVGFGYWYGNVVSNDVTGTVFNAGGGVWTGDVLGNNGFVDNDLGGIWTGNVVANAHMIQSIGIWNGNVETNNHVIYNAGGTWTGDVLANAAGAHVINQELPVNEEVADEPVAGHWIGDVETNDGYIWNRHGAVWTGNVVSNSGTIHNYADGDYTGTSWFGDVESNTGEIDNDSAWTGNFNSAGIVKNSGVLHLTGAASIITTLTNSGTISMQGGGAAQTLTSGTASFVDGPDTFFDVDVAAAGVSDRLIADTVTLGGTVRVSGAAASGSSTTPYVIVSSPGINGTFSGVTDDLVFLDGELGYESDAVTLTLIRNGVAFADFADSPNQNAVAAAVQSLGGGNPVYDAMLWLTDGDPAPPFDSFSGEIYSSVKGVFIQNAGVVADAATGRIDQAFDTADTGGASAVSAYADGPALPAGPERNNGLWGQAYGSFGSLAATDGTAGVDSSTGGLAAGFDRLLDEWRVGLMMQAGLTRATISALNSSSDSNDYGLGIYGGRQWGDTRLSLGAAYTRHDIRSTRDAVFPDAATLSADYSAGTAQAFGKLSHAFHMRAVTLTPFGSLALVSHATDGFTETGGDAALTSAANVMGAAFTTIGLGLDRQFVIADGKILSVKGSLGWRHAFAADPSSINNFTGGGDFLVLGAPIAGDSAVLSAGLNVDVGVDAALAVTYDGQIGGGTTTHAIRGIWSTRF